MRLNDALKFLLPQESFQLNLLHQEPFADLRLRIPSQTKREQHPNRPEQGLAECR
jgi:hypothetical protein